MQNIRFIVATTLLLTACGKAPQQDGNINNAVISDNGVAISPVDNVAKPDPADNAAIVAPAPNTIPVAFHGRWGMVPADCGPDASIAKGLLTIDDAQLRFYESVGKPAVVTYPTPSRVEGRFAFTGEGMDWSKDMTLALEGSGDRLVRTEKDPVASYGYKRCPA